MPLVKADLQELRKELTNKTLPVAFTRQCPRCRETIDLRECGVDKPINVVRDKPKRNACPHCKADFCQTCGGAWHEGKICRDAARDVGDLSDRLIDAQCKRCPNEACAVRLTHDHGKIAPLLYIYNISHTPPRSSPPQQPWPSSPSIAHNSRSISNSLLSPLKRKNESLRNSRIDTPRTYEIKTGHC